MVGCVWQAGRFEIGLDKPKIMGIVNLTPDSFSDGGAYSQNAQTALAHAERLLKEGADILDIGGESTRAGADYVSPEEEWARVEPVLAEVAGWGVPVSLDTRRTVVMEKALALGGIDIINDVAALTDEGAVELLARQTDTGICLMHMQGLPENMQVFEGAGGGMCRGRHRTATHHTRPRFRLRLRQNLATQYRADAAFARIDGGNRFAAAGRRVAQEHDRRADRRGRRGGARTRQRGGGAGFRGARRANRAGA